MNDVRLRKVGEEKDNTLPRGVHALTMNGQLYFVRRIAGRFIPLSNQEQELLRKRHIV